MGWCTELSVDDFKSNGHHLVKTPDGVMEESIPTVAKYIAKCKGDNSEIIDEGEDIVEDAIGTPDNMIVKYGIYGVELASGLTIDGMFIAYGKLVKTKGSNLVVFEISGIDGLSLPVKSKSKVNEKEIAKRWNERVLPNAWQTDAKGAVLYLTKYGKNISNDKLQAFADYARKQGCEAFAKHMESVMTAEVKSSIKEVTIAEAEKENFHGDIIDFANGVAGSKIIVATIQQLADMGIGSCCGNVGNKCFVKLAEKFPNILVRGALHGNEMSSVEMKISNDRMGYAISSLADKGDGSYRYDGDGADHSWEYFETE